MHSEGCGILAVRAKTSSDDTERVLFLEATLKNTQRQNNEAAPDLHSNGCYLTIDFRFPVRLLGCLQNYTRSTPIPVKMAIIDSEKRGSMPKINVAIFKLPYAPY